MVGSHLYLGVGCVLSIADEGERAELSAVVEICESDAYTHAYRANFGKSNIKLI